VSATASERAHESGLPRRFAGPGLVEIEELFAVMIARSVESGSEPEAAWGIPRCSWG